MQKMVESAPLMAKFTKNPVFKTLVLTGYWYNRSVANVENMFLYLMKHFMPGTYDGVAPLPEKVENEGIYHPAHKGMFATSAEYLKWYEPWFEKTYGRKPWDRIGFITHDLFLPDWNHPVLERGDRGVGAARRRRDLFDDRRLQRPHRLARTLPGQRQEAADLGRLPQRSALSRRLDVLRLARRLDRVH